MVESSSSEQLYQQIKALIDNGQVFKAYQRVRTALEEYPNSKSLMELYALALLKIGAADEAKETIYNILQIKNNKSDYLVALENEPVEFINRIAKIFKEAWTFSKVCKDLEMARDIYKLSYKKEKSPYSGTNAAWLSWLINDNEESKVIAEELIEILNAQRTDFRNMISLAELLLLVGKNEESVRVYEDAMKSLQPNQYTFIVKARAQLLFVKSAGFNVPQAVFDLLTPPTVLVFNGIKLDAPSSDSKVFPVEIEKKVTELVEKHIDQLNVSVAYSSASCGAEIIFIELMLKKGKEINIVLPFEVEDFVARNVRYAGPRWEKRFFECLAKAHSVIYATEDRYLNHDILYNFCNKFMHGTAVMRAHALTSEPHLLMLWNSTVKNSSQSSFIDQWVDISTLHFIDIEDIFPANVIDLATVGESHLAHKERVIKVMMFSDFYEYTKLTDEYIPSFLDFLAKIKQSIGKSGIKLDIVNTWGDALFVVASRASDLVSFALQYCNMIEEIGRKYPEFPIKPQARVALHAGPVYQLYDPFIRKDNFFGSHINLAARLEPVTKVSQIYATMEFVALLHAEMNAEKSETEQKGKKYRYKWLIEYVGLISLSYGYRTKEVYHIRKT